MYVKLVSSLSVDSPTEFVAETLYFIFVPGGIYFEAVFVFQKREASTFSLGSNLKYSYTPDF